MRIARIRSKRAMNTMQLALFTKLSNASNLAKPGASAIKETINKEATKPQTKPVK